MNCNTGWQPEDVLVNPEKFHPEILKKPNHIGAFDHCINMIINCRKQWIGSLDANLQFNIWIHCQPIAIESGAILCGMS